MKVILLFILMFSFIELQADIKGSARELLLEGERGKAYELLINGLSSKNSKSKNQSLKKELSNLSNIFISEQSQKYFQQAQTLFYSNDKGYEAKLKKAESLEPENLKIIFTKTWFFLIKKQCAKAKVELSKMKKLNIQYEGLSVTEFYTKLCAGKATAECGSINYNTRDSLRNKVFKLISCRSNKDNIPRLKAYCDLLKIDVPELPEIDLWCSAATNKMTSYESKCDSLLKKESNRQLLEVYPFLCVKEISSNVIKD